MDEQQPESVPHTKARRSQAKIWLAVATLLVIFGSFEYGLSLGKSGYVLDSKNLRVVNQKDQVFDVDYSLLWKAIEIVNDKYIDKPIDQQKVLYGAIHGAVAAAGDEYTQYFDPEELKEFETELAGSFDGIGAEIGKKNGNIVIIAPLPDSPAAKAGLRPKDVIVSVDGKSTTDWSTEQTVKAIRGPHGSEVTLTIYREGDANTFDVKIKRETISIKSVKLQVKDQNGKKIGLITISRFGDDTQGLLQRAVNDAKAQNVSGIILDLRNDPGGYLDLAIDTASYWLPKGDLVVTEAHSDGTSKKYDSDGNGKLQGLKTIVLINGGSASASEIVAGALQDHKAATLLGEKSFGKGSVQELVKLPDGSAVKVTVAKWITPGGKNLNKDGLVPDIEVKLTDDDIAASRDPQMDRALEEVVK